MGTAIRLLLVEDSSDDAELVLRALRRGGYDVTVHQVQTPEDMRRALEKESWDLVISDFVMPRFDGMRAVQTLRASGVDIPIIIVSGTIREDKGVEAMAAGASDYILKDNLTRLCAAVDRELREAVLRRDGRQSKAHALAATKELEVRRRVVEHMPVGVTVFEWEDPPDIGSFRVLWRNPTAARATGLGDELLGLTLKSGYSKLLATDIPQALATAIETGRPQALPPLQYGDVNVREAIWQVEAVPLGERLVGAFFTDVTERESLERQMRTAQRMEAVGRLAGSVAHDFNNVLTVINSYVGFLLEQLEEGTPTRADAQMIGEAANRAARLTSQLLAFSRQQPRELVVLSLNEMLGELDRMLRRLIGEDVELVAELEQSLGSVKLDRTQIEQVVMNLVVNARDAMPKGGRITIATANVALTDARAAHEAPVPPGRYVLLTVTDTGTGIEEDLQRHIFEPFFTTKEKGRGTGLGLSTVHGIVKQSDGHIALRSEVGRGTTFEVYLPRVDERPKRMTPHAHTRIVGGHERILIAEDEELVRTAAARILRRAGYEVVEAANGDEALTWARQEKGRIDLLLTDIVMPNLNGRDLADRVSALHPETRIIYMSGYTDDAIVHHGVLVGDLDLVNKPFTPETLLERIRDVLDRRDEPGS